MSAPGSPDAASAPAPLAKACSRCGVEKPAVAYFRRSDTRSGLQSACKECVRAARRAAYRANPHEHRERNHANYEKYGDTIRARARQARRENPEPYLAKTRAWRLAHPDRVRANALKARMSITPSDYDRMLREQDGRCAICRRPESVIDARTGMPKRLSIDHDHACCSGEGRACGACVRGLLCSRCNAALGFLGDNAALLEAGARYLRGHADRRGRAGHATVDAADDEAPNSPDVTKEAA